MKSILFYSLLNSLSIKIPPNILNFSIKSICCDSNSVEKDCLFLGIPGENFNGGVFWDEAIRNGAAAAIIGKSACIEKPPKESDQVLVIPDPVEEVFGNLISKFWDNPSKKMKLIGVTGTNGKTTTTFILEFLVKRFRNNTALFGTLFNRWSNFEEKAIHTTNFSYDLQRKLFLAYQSNVEYVILEVSSHALAQGRVAGCEFASAIFTNLSRDHLDYHATMESYFETKASLFTSNYLVNKNILPVINVDNEWGKLLANRLKGRCLRAGINQKEIYKNNDLEIYVTEIDYREEGTFCNLHTPSGDTKLYIPLIGEYNLMNVIQSFGMLIQFGFDLQELSEAIRYFPGVPGRMEKINCREELLSSKISIPTVIVDYAHTPDGLKNILINLRRIYSGKIICLFGCGGDRDTSKRSVMGSIAEKYSDKVVITSDNPRNEDPKRIINDILLGVAGKNNIIVEVDRIKAIEIAINLASKDDIVLIAGKGHEDYQVLKGITIEMDDREIAYNNLLKLKNGS
tara:strand:+ start:15388 stop:16929 length:1542 start_codon:yes stop_codon:yes gene_type:complete